MAKQVVGELSVLRRHWFSKMKDTKEIDATITLAQMVILGDDLRKEAAMDEKSAKQLIEEGEWADFWICLEVFRRRLTNACKNFEGKFVILPLLNHCKGNFGGSVFH